MKSFVLKQKETGSLLGSGVPSRPTLDPDSHATAARTRTDRDERRPGCPTGHIPCRQSQPRADDNPSPLLLTYVPLSRNQASWMVSGILGADWLNWPLSP